VPSGEVHRHANPQLKGDTWSFNFAPSLESDSADRWRKYQHTTKEVGRHILHVLRDQKLSPTPRLAAGSAQELPPGAIWVSIR
jgi:hypothetical protein